MTRLSFLTLLFSFQWKDEMVAEAEGFVKEWNRWASLLQKGERDLRLEKRVVDKFHQLERHLYHH
jgi:hypothetical protein